MFFGRGDECHITIEFEKIYRALLLQNKKKYAGEKWELEHGSMVLSDRVSVSGLETARRDPPPLVSAMVGYALAQLLDSSLSRNERLARIRARVHDIVGSLRAGTISFDQIIQSKKLSAPIDNYRRMGRALPIHVDVAARQDARREAGDANAVVSKPGDRVQFIVREVPLGHPASTNTSELGEEPLYAWRTGVRPNAKYYTGALMAAMCRILEFVVAPNIDATDEKVRERLADKAVITSFGLSAIDTASSLPSQPDKRVKVSSSVVTVYRCRLCKRRMTSDAICERCRDRDAPKLAALQVKDAEQRDVIERERASLFSTCSACQKRVNPRGGESAAAAATVLGDIEELDKAIPCENRTCDTLWQRLANDRLRKLRA